MLVLIFHGLKHLGLGTPDNSPLFKGNAIWHQGNDGPGTGLDADTVDGIQGASLLRSDASDTYSGGTLTIDGPLNMANTRQISFDRGSSDYSTMIYANNHPPAGYTSSSQGLLDDCRV